MYARVITYDMHEGKIEERLRHGQDVASKAWAGVKGFRDALILVDRKRHRNMTVTFWDTMDDLLASEKSAAFQSVSLFKHAAGHVTKEYFEVAAGGLKPGGKFARVNSYQVHQGKMGERIKHFNEGSQATAATIPGHKGAVVLADHAMHRNITISLWESDDLAKTVGSHEKFRQMAHHKFAAGRTHAEVFEVAIHHGR